ncbi:MAG TPA: signal peptidase II [Syntrophorhabdaceae bacterium]|nr:signal peptidase II [Syntrophorhabdaceae bacterium]HOL05499.1 signal peptidase II [Syntrophorhabdaceae bacterium]HON85460.1 signal peptidase II [Syntrophorhabdaceae bacterium]HOT41419.1 signal peptidase II [Syntrophorhabdaceae bacterium]HPC66892.1 signal peptidase II [Syntrophorhabdaceae bacterium]
MRRYLIFTIVPIVFLLDRWTKALITERISYLDGIGITSFFSIVHARNYGGAFSLLSQHHLAKYIFTFLPLIIVFVLIFIVLRYSLPFSKMLSLVFILSGAIGNIYDRMVYGYVIDFLDFFYKNYHWPAFNVADISISFGVCLWLFLELLSMIRKK